MSTSCQGGKDLASVGFLEAVARMVGAPWNRSKLKPWFVKPMIWEMPTSCVRAPSSGDFPAPSPLARTSLRLEIELSKELHKAGFIFLRQTRSRRWGQSWSKLNVGTKCWRSSRSCHLACDHQRSEIRCFWKTSNVLNATFWMVFNDRQNDFSLPKI